MLEVIVYMEFHVWKKQFDPKFLTAPGTKAKVP
jgi:hypothetical protein